MDLKAGGKKDLWVFSGLVVLSLILVFRYLNFCGFTATHYLFSYQDGLYSRALTGPLIRAVVPGLVLLLLSSVVFSLALGPVSANAAPASVFRMASMLTGMTGTEF